MGEGKLQVEGEVIHVIVQRCHDFSRLLRRLTASKAADPQVLTLARPDEQSIPAHAQIKKKLLKESDEEKAFYAGRNFR